MRNTKKIVIVGGKLQGTEAAFLGKEAGFTIVLIDKNPMAPAKDLCTQFICADVLSEDVQVLEALASADMVLPTMENPETLADLTRICREKDKILAFDLNAYRISSSKKKSDRLFVEHGLPCPKYWPEGKPPYIAKPDADSGSHGVKKLATQEELEAFLIKDGSRYVIQEFAEGPSYSLEIIGRPGNYRIYMPTEIFMDEVFDCRLASVYRLVTPEKRKILSDYAVQIAEALGLIGIMDLEVIDTGSEMKILEIDARLPSQTPLAVYFATGMNYIKELYELFCQGDFQTPLCDLGRYASYMQYLITGDAYTALGERIMVDGGPLHYEDAIFGKARVVTDYAAGAKIWRGIFVHSADSAEELAENEALTRRKIETMI